MLSCECDYDTTFDFFNEVERTARKAHKCSECRRVINPSERYVYGAGKRGPRKGEMYAVPWVPSL